MLRKNLYLVLVLFLYAMFSIQSFANTKTLKVGVITWGGFAGGEYFNEGFEANENSRYFKDYGIKVDFILNDDPESARADYINGKLDIAEISIDAISTEIDLINKTNSKIIFLADWSRGGDSIVVTEKIETVNDLEGKRIAVNPGSCSHTFLMWVLESAGIDYNNVIIVPVASTEDAAELFKIGRVDIAVVWSPEDEICIQSVKNSKILISTKEASNVIADAFMVKKDFLDKNKKEVKALIEGWLIGASEINADEKNKIKASKILAKAFNEKEDVTLKAINNTRLATYGDNINFFGLNKNYKGIIGEDIYLKSAGNFAKLGLAPAYVPEFKDIVDTSILQMIKLTGDIHRAEKINDFDKKTSEKIISTKRITVNFPSNSYELDENAKMLIKLQFGDIARAFGNTKIKIEGNTDNTGSEELNNELSKKRAEAVAEFLEKEYGFGKNRFIVIGNGFHKPVADNSNPEGRAKNRRTDFSLVQ